MSDHPKIFRAAALQRYLQDRQTSVLPRMIAPRTFAYLWSCIGLLSISGVTAWFTRIPIYVSGSAIVAEYAAVSQEHENQIFLLASFPFEAQAQLEIGQPLVLQIDQAEWIYRNIIEIKANTLSSTVIQPAAIQNSHGSHLLTQSTSIAIAPLEPIPSATVHIGRIYPVNVEVGSRRMISLLPVVGNLLADTQNIEE